MGAAQLEVIVGPMFSGKTETLIKRVWQMSHFHGWEVAVFKPTTDTRHIGEKIVSHDGTQIDANWIGRDAAGLPHNVSLIALDEVQFFSLDAVPRILEAVYAGVRVVAAGLDLTYRDEPFGPVPALMAYADVVTKLTSRCSKCHQPATRTQRKDALVASAETVLVGGAESYEPRCLACYDLKGGT
jgi:thymidine kinase